MGQINIKNRPLRLDGELIQDTQEGETHPFKNEYLVLNWVNASARSSITKPNSVVFPLWDVAIFLAR